MQTNYIRFVGELTISSKLVRCQNTELSVTISLSNIKGANRMTENNNKLTFFAKPAKGKMTTLFVVFLWIILWNVIYQIIHPHLHDSPLMIENWAFFISVTIFFMQEELTPKQRFWHTLVGGTVGLLIAAGVVVGCKQLMALGLSHTLAIIILLIIAIAMLILLHPYMPMFFNNVGFCYFIVSLVDSSKTVEKLPDHLFSLLLGSICLNLGVIGVLRILKKVKAKKSNV